jgi:HSP20 family protein
MEVERLNRMFADFYGDQFGRGWSPAVDIFETENHEVVLKAELPEMKREDINITFENQVLTIRGERKVDQNIRRDRYQRLERSYGSFSRSFTIPSTIDAGRIAASYKDGVLTVRLPQREEAKPKPIEVAD